MLEGVGISGYRSFGEHRQLIGPLAKINILAGPNNSGKSNVLRFLHDHLGLFVKAVGVSGAKVNLQVLDAHRPSGATPGFAVGALIDGPLHEQLREQFPTADSKHQLDVMMAVLAQDGVAWLHFVRSPDGRTFEPDREWTEKLMRQTTAGGWDLLARKIIGPNPSSSPSQNLRAIAEKLAKQWLVDQRVALIPAIREIGRSDRLSSADYRGTDLIHRLAALQNPSITEFDEGKTTFGRINGFLRTVTDVDDAEIEIPHDRETINVTMGRHVLPLEHLGTGIHEVTMIAAWATILDEYLVCIEEPELHLHPILQRKLISYLASQTTNRYVITTHSAHLLDYSQAAVFHVRFDGSESVVSRCLSPASRVEICADLGYRSSDLLQANSVIWVEGPTDRLYIRYWLSLVDADLVEGVHYSLMFYGGRLLSHLSADDVEIEDFISLRRINQWLSIVIDSDRSAPRAKLNATKLRVRDEFDGGPGLAWVTYGREIENYIDAGLFTAAVHATHQAAKNWHAPTERYADVTSYSTQSGARQAVDKLKVAHSVLELGPSLDVYDLKHQVTNLAKFIHTANG